MKTLYKATKISIGVFLAALLIISCVPEQQSLDGAGQTLVKLNPADFSLLAVDAKTTAQTGILFEVMRDLPSESALNTQTTVVLDYDVNGSILAAYNTAHSTSFIPLPANLGTTDPAITSGQLTIVFQPGEAVKTVKVNLPSTASFDFSKQYAFAFKLSSVTGTGTMSEAVGKTVVAQVIAKNKYDGKYKMKGFIMRPGDTGGLEGYFKNFEYKGSTSGATAIKLNRLQQWANESNVGGIGIWTLTVNETGNPPYGITLTDPTNPANFRLDPDYPNRYDPATKTFYFKVQWGATLPYIRGCTDTLTYVGPQ